MSTMLWFSTNGLSLALSVKEKMYELALSLDGIVYTFINFLFKLFLVLARANIFSNDETYKLVGRIYQLVGVIMLFVFTYAMLRKIVSPDGKDKDSPSKIVFNIVKAIVLLAIVPSIFSYAFQIQEAILKQNTIGKVILGTSGNNTGATSPNEVIDKGGVTMAQGVFEAFFFPTNGDENTEVMSGVTYKELEEEVQQSGSFSVYQNSAGAVENGSLTYYWGMCLIGGAVVIYMLISYCISLGFRIVKLAFYEIMAPVCIIASILPSQKEMLSRWVKSTLSVFTEVFIRIAILYFITYIIQVVKNSMAAGQIFPTDLDFKLKALGFAAIIMGLVTFMKSAPDLISKLTGIESGNMSLGIKDQLAKGGFFTAGAIAGGAITSGVRNALSLPNRMKNAKDRSLEKRNKIDADSKGHKGIRKAGVRVSSALSRAGAVAGVLTGAVSGGAHAFNKDAKSFSDMKEGATKGAKEATARRDARISRGNRYYASEKNAITGRFSDWKDAASDWATGGAAQFQEAIDVGKKYGDKFGTIKSKTESIREKMKGDTALVDQTGSSLTAPAQAELTALRGIFGGDVSIANVEDFAKSLAEPLDRNKFATQALYDQAMAKRLQEASVINNQLLPLLRKYADLDIQNAVINGHYGTNGIYLRGDTTKEVAGFGADKFGEVSSAIDDFKTTFEIMGSRLAEKDKDGKTINVYTEAKTAEQIKKVADAAQNNYNLAAAQTSIYEQKKAARKGEDKK